MAKKKQRDPPPKFSTGGDWHTHHVILFDDLLNSQAYLALSAHAKEAYTILLQEYKGIFTGAMVMCPYSTFKEKKVRANTLSRSLMQLETFGFIEIEHGGLEHQPSRYRFVDKWKALSDPDLLKRAKDDFDEAIRRKKLAGALKRNVN